jgi:hypothetical protein
VRTTEVAERVCSRMRRRVQVNANFKPSDERIADDNTVRIAKVCSRQPTARWIASVTLR